MKTRRATTVENAVQRFIGSLQGRNASVHTIKAYRTDLAQFAEHVGPQGWTDIDHVLIRGYLSGLYGRGLSKTSVARALAALRSLYRWLAQEGEVEQNPAALVATPRLPKKLPRVPTIEEVNMVLDAAMPDSSAFAKRDQVILELLYGCGIRNSELVGINVDDIRWSNEVILVRGKGRKERYVPFGDSARASVQAYLPARQRVLAGTKRNGERALLINLRGSRLTTRSVGRIVKHIAVACGLSPGVHPHTGAAPRLRHTYAGRGCGPARHPGDARPREALDHTTLHSAHGQARDGGVRPDAPACQRRPLAAECPALQNSLRMHARVSFCDRQIAPTVASLNSRIAPHFQLSSPQNSASHWLWRIKTAWRQHTSYSFTSWAICSTQNRS